MINRKRIKHCALVLGGHVNGLSIVRELFDSSITEIVVFDTKKTLAFYSNKVKKRVLLNPNHRDLLAQIRELNCLYEKIVIFPTSDTYLELLNHIYVDISAYCYLPFNKDSLSFNLDKSNQYKLCQRLGIPYPRTVAINCENDLRKPLNLEFPLLLKPTTRKDLNGDIFRSLSVHTRSDYSEKISYLANKLKKGFNFIASEIVPGDDTEIFAYTCFRGSDGRILNEWAGKKLSQFPDSFGVFASASDEKVPQVLMQGRRLAKAIDAHGILEPEFKYDHRDDSYKLMEINLRSMMWHRVGSLSGVNLHETMYKYAIGASIKRYEQSSEATIHLVLMLHELPNLIARKGYWTRFRSIIWGGKKCSWAIFDWNDPLPFFFSLFSLLKISAVACLRRFGFR